MPPCRNCTRSASLSTKLLGGLENTVANQELIKMKGKTGQIILETMKSATGKGVAHIVVFVLREGVSVENTWRKLFLFEQNWKEIKAEYILMLL